MKFAEPRWGRQPPFHEVSMGWGNFFDASKEERTCWNNKEGKKNKSSDTDTSITVCVEHSNTSSHPRIGLSYFREVVVGVPPWKGGGDPSNRFCSLIIL